MRITRFDDAILPEWEPYPFSGKLEWNVDTDHENNNMGLLIEHITESKPAKSFAITVTFNTTTPNCIWVSAESREMVSDILTAIQDSIDHM